MVNPVASTSGRAEPAHCLSVASRHCMPKVGGFLSPRRSRCQQRRAPGIVTHALRAEEVGQRHEGLFDAWTLEEADRREVLSYRFGLTVAASALLLDSLIALLPDGNALREASRGAQNAIAVAGAAGLGASYWLIHIYVTPLKRFLQALYAAGCAGGLYLAASQGAPVPEYVASHREAVWLVGPLFASVTGLGIKEGLCYGTLPATLIVLVTPTLCLGHLSGLMPTAGTQALLAALNVLAVAFAAGKYGQPLAGDIGDRSIFDVQALPREQQEARWAALRQARGGGGGEP